MTWSPAGGWAERVVAIAGVIITLGAILWSMDVPLKLGVPVYTEQFIAAMLGLALFIAYLRTGTGATRGVARW